MYSENRPIALILGGSSGLGGATALKLAQEGYDLIVVHRDRRADLEEIEARFQAIRNTGAVCYAFNADATNQGKQSRVWADIKAKLKGAKIKVLVHSIAKGNLRPMNDSDNGLSNQDFQLTIQAMALSLFDWVKLIANDALLDEDTRIIAFTSEGNLRAIPNYAAVSAAKTALESIIRNIALEYAAIGVKANCIQAGITDTKSLRMIPNHKALIDNALSRNPNKRLTTPEDVANAVYLLTRPEAQWITGTIIKVDGGESLQ